MLGASKKKVNVPNSFHSPHKKRQGPKKFLTEKNTKEKVWKQNKDYEQNKQQQKARSLEIMERFRKKKAYLNELEGRQRIGVKREKDILKIRSLVEEEKRKKAEAKEQLMEEKHRQWKQTRQADLERREAYKNNKAIAPYILNKEELKQKEEDYIEKIRNKEKELYKKMKINKLIKLDYENLTYPPNQKKVPLLNNNEYVKPKITGKLRLEKIRNYEYSVIRNIQRKDRQRRRYIDVSSCTKIKRELLIFGCQGKIRMIKLRRGF